jgi:hypothetical protein
MVNFSERCSFWKITQIACLCCNESNTLWVDAPVWVWNEFPTSLKLSLLSSSWIYAMSEVALGCMCMYTHTHSHTLSCSHTLTLSHSLSLSLILGALCPPWGHKGTVGKIIHLILSPGPWLQIQKSWVWFPALPHCLRSSGSGTGST